MTNSTTGLLKDDDKFKFSCHDGLACFNKCCRDISIFLTPFDVLRIKNKLNISSGELLEKCAITFTAGYSGLPLFFIRMREDRDLACPFLTEKGCGVYDERPGSCRMAPVEIRGNGVYGFCFENSRCHGLNEDKEQTVREWMRGQGMDVYEEVEKLFQEIPLRIKFSGEKNTDELIRKAFHMACYDLDRFRKFIFDTSFIETYQVPKEVARKLRADDRELLQFGFKWLLDEFGNMSGIKRAVELLKSFD